MSLERPDPFKFVWAENGEKWDLPESGADHNNGRADIQTGFPKQTMISVINGGVPPYGRDHNTILNCITKDLQWTQAGGLPVFDEGLRDKIMGYPVGIELRSTRYSYVSYINMVNPIIENGRVVNQKKPDNYTSLDDYWVSSSKIGNGWAIKTILSDDVDNISFLDSNFRIVTKATGSKTDLYVRLSSSPNTEDDSKKADGSKENPFKNPQDAIDAIPDGGSGNIHMWQPDVFTLNSWNIKRKQIFFYPWFDEDDNHKTVIDYLSDILVEKVYLYSAYLMKNYLRVQVEINITKSPIVKDVYDPGGFEGTGKASFYGFEFIATQQVPDGYTLNGASPFHPQITYNFIGCIFSNLEYLDFWFNGWQNDITYDMKFNHCLFNGDQSTLINLNNGIVNINSSTDEDWTWIQALTDMDIGYLPGNNSLKYLSRTSHYSNFKMQIIGYTDEDATNPIYYPNGLKTNFDLVFD